MSRRGNAALVAAVVLILGIGVSGQEKPWFDMENCSFCKPLLEEPGLLDNMIWEHHDISNGLLAITIVAPGFEKAYQKAMESMQKVAQDMAQGGKSVEMCGHCQYYGMLMMSGAKLEPVKTGAGDIMLITTDKPEILEKIREYGRRNREELAKMEAKD